MSCFNLLTSAPHQSFLLCVPVTRPGCVHSFEILPCRLVIDVISDQSQAVMFTALHHLTPVLNEVQNGTQPLTLTLTLELANSPGF